MTVLALAACDESSINPKRKGIESLGDGFAGAFGKAANDAPVDSETLALEPTPLAEPFDP